MTINVNPGTIDFTKDSNHLAAEVAKFPETQVTKRNVSYVGTGGQQGGNHWQGGATAPSTGVHADENSIFTRSYTNFNSLSKDEKRKIHEEHKDKGTNKGKKGKYPYCAVKLVETTKQLNERIKKLHLKISALKRKNRRQIQGHRFCQRQRWGVIRRPKRKEESQVILMDIPSLVLDCSKEVATVSD